jgi:acetoin utilization deacetylase AcuC-like enzyme
MRAVLDYLPTSEIWPRLIQHEAPLANREQLYRAHDKDYVDAVIAAEPAQGRLREPHQVKSYFMYSGK